ncbi:MAG: dihydroorotate dehydrogenase electron transfer subunit [Alicyclobacillaceae bacterium]|nr:dihydroorotate dehydrogenase electron transfer subunit [Alicyclobacillaceae bacterium]
MPVDIHVARVVSNEWVSSRYKHMTVDAPAAAAAAEPGQFFHLRCADRFDPLLRRPMSVYQIDREKGRIHFLYHVKGSGTRLLAELEVDDTLDLVGPLGRGFRLDPQWKRILLVARGVGLATLGPLAETAQRAGMRTFAVLSARSRSDLLSVDRMRQAGAEVFPVTDEERTSDVGAVERLVRTIIEQEGIDAVFTCGSKRLIRLLQQLAGEYGIPGQVALEENMGCGLGMCFCCVKPFRRDGSVAHLRVCREGPVFSLEEVIADAL